MTDPDDSDREFTEEERRRLLDDPDVAPEIRQWVLERDSWPGGPEARAQFWLMTTADPTNSAAVDEEVARLQHLQELALDEVDRAEEIEARAVLAARILSEVLDLATPSERERLLGAIEHLAYWVDLTDEDDDL